MVYECDFDLGAIMYSGPGGCFLLRFSFDASFRSLLCSQKRQHVLRSTSFGDCLEILIMTLFMKLPKRLDRGAPALTLSCILL